MSEAPDPRHDLLVTGCTVVRPDGSHAADQTIGIRSGRITSIAASGDPPSPSSAARVIDATGLVAVPGLVNAHTHSPMALLRGAAEDVEADRWFNDFIWPMEANLIDGDVHLGALLACAEMLQSGVTAFADHYFAAHEIAAAVRTSGIRANLGWTFFSSDGDAGVERSAAFAREHHRSAGGRITTSLAPHAPYTVVDDHLAAAADHARAIGVPVHVHASEYLLQAESSLAKRGITPIEVLRRTGVLDAGAIIAHGCGILPQDLPALAEHADRVTVPTCPKVYLKHALAPLTPVRALHEHGVRVAIGTDGVAGHNTHDVWESMRLTAMVQKQQERDATFLPVARALRLATADGMAALGWPDGGRLEVGALADVVLVDVSGLHCRPVHDLLATLVYSVRAADVVHVIVAGDVVVERRRVVQVDVAALLEEIEARVGRLVARDHGRTVQTYDP